MHQQKARRSKSIRSSRQGRVLDCSEFRLGSTQSKGFASWQSYGEASASSGPLQSSDPKTTNEVDTVSGHSLFRHSRQRDFVECPYAPLSSLLGPSICSIGFTSRMNLALHGVNLKLRPRSLRLDFGNVKVTLSMLIQNRLKSSEEQDRKMALCLESLCSSFAKLAIPQDEWQSSERIPQDWLVSPEQQDLSAVAERIQSSYQAVDPFTVDLTKWRKTSVGRVMFLTANASSVLASETSQPLTTPDLQQQLRVTTGKFRAYTGQTSTSPVTVRRMGRASQV